MNDELGATAVEIAEEWAREAMQMMSDGLGEQPMNGEKVKAATALLNRATALRGRQ